VLAYSTVSQLGFMFLAAGVGAFIAAIFHVFTHAFFKALLFLGSGSVIHGMHHEQDMRRMGGLKKYMPTTHITMFAGWLAICGIPIWAGFFSKDEILWLTYNSHVFGGTKVLWFIGLLTAGVTAFYMTRLMALTFWSKERFREAPAHDDHAGHAGHDDHSAHDDHGHGGHHVHEPHESPTSMTMPLMVLAVCSTLVGLLGIPHLSAFEHWLEPVIAKVGEHGEHAPFGAQEFIFMVLSIAVATAGIFLARQFYLNRPQLAEEWTRRLQPLYKLSANKWYWDYLLDVKGVEAGKAVNNGLWKVDAAVVDGSVNGAGAMTKLWARVSNLWDKYIVDMLVNATGWISQGVSIVLRAFQTGFWQNYVLVFALGLFLIFAFYLYPAISATFKAWANK
jgi:NADH-quinone oxidoreductase subunit L